MHYSNGRKAQVGDVVRGMGYNIKHEIVGLMMKIKPGESACNCEVSCVSTGSLVFVYANPSNNNEKTSHYIGRDITNTNSPATYRVEPSIEYGQCDHFVALDPETGEVLPPENEKVEIKQPNENSSEEKGEFFLPSNNAEYYK